MNVLAISHVMIGRFRRSLYVGKITEYLFAVATDIVSLGVARGKKRNETRVCFSLQSPKIMWKFDE